MSKQHTPEWVADFLNNQSVHSSDCKNIMVFPAARVVDAVSRMMVEFGAQSPPVQEGPKGVEALSFDELSQIATSRSVADALKRFAMHMDEPTALHLVKEIAQHFRQSSPAQSIPAAPMMATPDSMPTTPDGIPIRMVIGDDKYVHLDDVRKMLKLQPVTAHYASSSNPDGTTTHRLWVEPKCKVCSDTKRIPIFSDPARQEYIDCSFCPTRAEPVEICDLLDKLEGAVSIEDDEAAKAARRVIVRAFDALQMRQPGEIVAWYDPETGDVGPVAPYENDTHVPLYYPQVQPVTARYASSSNPDGTVTHRLWVEPESNADTITVPREQWESLKWYASTVRFASKRGVTSIAEAFACGCRGPRPDCPCVMKSRAVDAALATPPDPSRTQG